MSTVKTIPDKNIEGIIINKPIVRACCGVLEKVEIAIPIDNPKAICIKLANKNEKAPNGVTIPEKRPVLFPVNTLLWKSPIETNIKINTDMKVIKM